MFWEHKLHKGQKSWQMMLYQKQLRVMTKKIFVILTIY